MYNNQSGQTLKAQHVEYYPSPYQPSPSPVPSNYSGSSISRKDPMRNIDNAFPTFAPGIPVKSVYERAGFDVNRGDKRKKKKDKSGRLNSATSSSSGGSFASSAKNFLGLKMNLKSQSPTASEFRISPPQPLVPPKEEEQQLRGHDHYENLQLPQVPEIQVQASEYPTPPQSSVQTHFDDDALSDNTHDNQDRFSQNSIASSNYSLSQDPVMDSSPSISSRPSREYGRLGSVVPPRMNLAQQISLHEKQHPLQHEVQPPLPPMPPLQQYHNPNQHSASSSESSVNQSLYSANTLSSPTSPADTDEATTPRCNNNNNNRPPLGKKCCRGCEQTIVGKCVSSKALTGKWHRQCFKCHGCQSSFDTSEFYILHDWPYCHKCYHFENNSICYGCGSGIEGECLETVGSGSSELCLPIRYHMECLNCGECGASISDEYFFDGHRGITLCMDHDLNVYANANRMSTLEKRRTRVLQL